jgi:hypothetical protein
MSRCISGVTVVLTDLASFDSLFTDTMHRDDVPHIAAERVYTLEPFALDCGCPLAYLAIILADILKLTDGTRQDNRPEGQGDAALLNVRGVLGWIEADLHT